MVVTQSEEYDVQVLILKRLRTILGLWGGIVDYYCPHEQKLGKRFLFYDLFAIRDDGEDFCSSMWFFDAARVLITLAFSGWDEPEEDKTQLKVLKLTKQLLGAIYNYMEARIEGAALRNIKDGLYADFVASWVNKELVVLNPQLQKLDHQALSLVRELMRRGSSDDVIWQALCSVVSSLVPLGRCNVCEVEGASFHAFSVCEQCETGLYCSCEYH